MTALGAACVDYGATTTGFHAHTKTMGALAAGNGRLIGTFHFLLPLSNQASLVGLLDGFRVNGFTGEKAHKKPRIIHSQPPSGECAKRPFPILGLLLPEQINKSTQVETACG